MALLFVGCKTVDYRAAKLPEHLRAAPSASSSDLDLARMAGLGRGTSQISAGDLVELAITSGRADEIAQPIQARVSHAGQLAIPLIGSVPVAGLEPPEAEQRIANTAVDRNVYRQPNVTLQIVEQAVNRVTVLGAVANPGVHSLPRGSSDLANAIAAAGGLTDVAGTKVDVLRNDSPTFYADDSDRAAEGIVLASHEESESPSNTTSDETVAARTQPSTNPPRAIRLDLAQAPPSRHPDHLLNDRDVVMVLPEDKRLIHVTGLVNHSNQFELPRNQDMTILDAIALAGGVSSPVADKVYVIRHQNDLPAPIIIQASIRKAKGDGDENLRLAPGDLVSVEATSATVLVDGLKSFFRITMGFGRNIAVF